ncbi:MAG: pseudouridine synthase [Bacteroidetes bacterium]|nr:MAG: pseudouridine synthase [Bacteroidota bacterium]
MLRYYVIYKPYQTLSQFTNTKGKKCLADYFKVEKDVYSIGRLDYDSEGLLILSNDSSLNNQLLNPRFRHEREYWVQVDGDISEDALTKIRKGVNINVDGKVYTTLPSKIRKLESEPNIPERNPPIRFRKNIPTSWVAISLVEGKNRQVRKMMAAVGFPVLRLIRYRIENLVLEDMKPGEIRSLTRETMVKQLFGK